jgi:cell fate (sporulation/competence/biofilm development) regulator YlbF (YheA/YmcA/DUF963 family)
MTNKEKAKELVEKFAQIQRDFNQKNYYGQAKKSALICVDECIKEHCHESEHKEPNAQDRWIAYWQEVKQEINKL